MKIFIDYNDKFIYNLKLVKTDKLNTLDSEYALKLKTLKEKIDNNEDEWDKYKKIVNPYELIHSSNLKEKIQRSISKYNPLSRSFFKLTEIIYKYKLFNKVKTPITMAGIAEGPGGFLEAFYLYRKHYGFENDIIKGITLNPYNKYIPNWNKINDRFENIETYYGDIYLKKTIDNFSDKFNKKVDIATADGGFDYSVDFNNQEMNSSKIIFAEVVMAFNILKENGIFIIKIFDLFNKITVKILFLIYKQFKEFHIYKPNTSRPANSEKYIIATGFKSIEKENLDNMKNCLYNWGDNKIHYDFERFDIPKSFYKQISDYNKIFVNNQIKYINETLYFINNKINKDEYNNIISNQVTNAINWVRTHNIEINKKSKFYNSFSIKKYKLN